MCERWAGDRTKHCNILTPALPAIAAFLSRSPELLNRGPGGPASAGTWFSFQHLLSDRSDFLSHPGYIIICRPPASCERHNSHSIQPIDSQGYPPISSTGWTCYLHRCISYFDSSAGGQYVTATIKNLFNLLWFFLTMIFCRWDNEYTDCIPWIWVRNPTIKGMSWVWYKTIFDAEAPVLKIWKIWSILSLPLLPGLLWHVEVVAVRVPTIIQINLVLIVCII